MQPRHVKNSPASRYLQVLPGVVAAYGYRVSSRQKGSSKKRFYQLKYYISFRGKRISPYFPTPMWAARWLSDKIDTSSLEIEPNTPW